METTRDDLGRFAKGRTPHNRKPKVDKVCPGRGKPFQVIPSLDRVVHCSQSCARRGKLPACYRPVIPQHEREKMRRAKLGIRGPDHWNWRGGKRTERKRAMARDEYVQWRKSVFARDGYTCSTCGVRGGELHAHHVLGWADHPSRRYDVDNGVTLCKVCHLRIHGRGKENE